MMNLQMLFYGAMLFATGAWAQEDAGVPLLRGPDKGGMLPESVQNEVDVAIERGVRWLAGQQNEDGSFGETNRLYYTMSAESELMKQEMLEQQKRALKWVADLLEEKDSFEEGTRLLDALNATAVFVELELSDEAEHAIKWIAKRQNEDGSFGETHRVFLTMYAGGFLMAQGMNEAVERSKKWIFSQFTSAAELANASNEEHEIINPFSGVDQTNLEWREKLAARRLSTQVVNGGIGFWRGSDVPELKIEKGELRHGKMTMPRAVLDVGSPLSDLEATIFVLWQLKKM